MVSFALATEILQDVMHLGRAMEIMDIVADTVGATIGGLIYLYIRHRKTRN